MKQLKNVQLPQIKKSYFSLQLKIIKSENSDNKINGF